MTTAQYQQLQISYDKASARVSYEDACANTHNEPAPSLDAALEAQDAAWDVLQDGARVLGRKPPTLQWSTGCWNN